MAATDMRWRLLKRALSVRNQRVMIVFWALSVGAAIIFALSSVYFDINIKMSRELRAFGANFYVGPTATHQMPESAFGLIEKEAPAGLIEAGSPYLYGTARSELERIALVGVNFESLRKLVPYWQVEGQWISVNFDDRNAMIGRTLAQRLNLTIGSSLALIKGNDKRSFKIKGIIDAGDASDSLLFLNLEPAQDWLDKPDTMSHALFSMINIGNGVEAFSETLRREHPEWAVHPIRKVSNNEGEVLHKIRGLMGLVSVVVLLLSTLCVNTSLTAIIGERQREFALQKALGASNQTIVSQVLLETLVIACFAVIAGCLLGFLLAQILGQTVFSAAIGLRAPVVPITIILSLTTAFAAAVFPLRRIWSIQPSAVLKGE